MGRLRENALPAARKLNGWKSPLVSPSKSEFSEMSNIGFFIYKKLIPNGTALSLPPTIIL